jgi:hypothetical protein
MKKILAMITDFVLTYRDRVNKNRAELIQGTVLDPNAYKSNQ